MDAELNRYILMNESKGLVAGYPQSMLDILGNSNIAAVHGSAHKFLRGALLSLVSPQMLRDIVLPRIDRFMSSQLSNWDGKIINLQDHTKEVIFLSIMDQIASIDPASRRADYFKTHFFKLVLGTLSLPINLPGTNYRNGVQVRSLIFFHILVLIDMQMHDNFFTKHRHKHTRTLNINLTLLI
ncbi:Cytochrome P450 85A, variant 4 [Lathyrus oleraceus]|nr:Cytochrome P450 85A, variant 4 [Pisum sativum]